jgi:hypothetical protein
MNAVAGDLKDKKKFDAITRDWRDFFRDKYRAIVERQRLRGRR